MTYPDTEGLYSVSLVVLRHNTAVMVGSLSQKSPKITGDFKWGVWMVHK